MKMASICDIHQVDELISCLLDKCIQLAEDSNSNFVNTLNPGQIEMLINSAEHIDKLLESLNCSVEVRDVYLQRLNEAKYLLHKTIKTEKEKRHQLLQRQLHHLDVTVRPLTSRWFSFFGN